MLKREKLHSYIPYALILLLYAVLHTRYMPEYLDDAWTLSWAYRLINFQDVTDHVFGYIGSRGSILFGRGYSYFYGFILSVIGWSRSNAVLISTALIWLNAFIWYKNVIKLGYKKDVAKTVSILLLVMEIFFSLGNKLRSDALSLTLISFAFYLFISRKYLFAGLLSIIAFEVHVISLTFYFYILAYLISIWDDMRSRPVYYVKGAGKFLLGVVLGLIYYCLLQWDYLSTFFDKTTAESVGHTLFAYFWKMKFAWRHLPEIVIILTALILFIKKQKYKEDKFTLPFFTLCLLSTFILRRGNYHYTAFIYPSVVLLISSVLDSKSLKRWFWILLICYLLPQYAYLYYESRDFNQNRYEESIINMFPETDEMIIGNPLSWFALKEYNFHEYGYFNRQQLTTEQIPEKFYLISTKRYRDNISGYREILEQILVGYESKKIDSFIDYTGYEVELYLLWRENE